MKKVIVEIYFTGTNFCAHAPVLPGCVSTADTLDSMKKNIKEAIDFHVESSLAENDDVPDVFKGKFELEFVLSAEAFLQAYSAIFTKSALSRVTGIGQRQLWHYAAGKRKPRLAQTKRIQNGLHQLGKELLLLQLGEPEV